MNIDIDIVGERPDGLVVSAEIGYVDDPEAYPISIGQKVFDGSPGKFTYKWLIEWMDLYEVAALRDALTFIIDHRIEMVCAECEAGDWSYLTPSAEDDAADIGERVECVACDYPWKYKYLGRDGGDGLQECPDCTVRQPCAAHAEEFGHYHTCSRADGGTVAQ